MSEVSGYDKQTNPRVAGVECTVTHPRKSATVHSGWNIRLPEQPIRAGQERTLAPLPGWTLLFNRDPGVSLRSTPG